MSFFKKWSTGPLSTEKSLRSLFFLRNLAIIGQSLGILVTVIVFRVPLPLIPMMIILSLEIIVNIVSRFRLNKEWPVTELEIFIHLSIDSLFLSALLYFSGGANNPFIYLLLIPTAIATVSLKPLKVLILALLQIFLYSLLTEFRHPLVIPSTSSLDNFHIHLLGMWINFILSTALIGFFGVTMSRHLHLRDSRLQQLREQQLRDEQILTLGVISAGAAHELGTPLSTMALIAEELKHQFKHQPAAADLVILEEQIQRCSKIIRELGERSLQFTDPSIPSRNLQDILETVFEQWQVTRPEIWVSQRWALDCGSAVIKLDLSFDQALTNILNNAADASLENGHEVIELFVTCERPASSDKIILMIEIRDFGKGISPELKSTLGRIPLDSKKSNGLGWGWLLTNASIERLGGEVQLVPHSEKGTIAIVKLPLENS